MGLSVSFGGSTEKMSSFTLLYCWDNVWIFNPSPNTLIWIHLSKYSWPIIVICGKKVSRSNWGWYVTKTENYCTVVNDGSCRVNAAKAAVLSEQNHTSGFSLILADFAKSLVKHTSCSQVLCCYESAPWVVKKSNWPILTVKDIRFVQSSSKLFLNQTPFSNCVLWPVTKMDMWNLFHECVKNPIWHFWLSLKRHLNVFPVMHRLWNSSTDTDDTDFFSSYVSRKQWKQPFLYNLSVVTTLILHIYKTTLWLIAVKVSILYPLSYVYFSSQIQVEQPHTINHSENL